MPLFKVLKSFTADVTIGSDEDEEPVTEEHTFKAGEVLDFDVLEEDKTTFREIQFGDGDMAFGLPKNLFQQVKDKGMGEAALEYPEVEKALGDWSDFDASNSPIGPSRDERESEKRREALSDAVQMLEWIRANAPPQEKQEGPWSHSAIEDIDSAIDEAKAVLEGRAN